MLPEGYNELVSSAAVAHWPGQEAVRLSGSDATPWLQGQVTNDLRLLDSQDFLDACLVKPTGQLLATVRVFRERDGLVVISQNLGVLRGRIAQFVILEDVRIEELGPVTSVQGPTAWQVGQGFRSPRLGYDGIETLIAPDGLVRASPAAVNRLTLELSIPLIGVDTDEKTLPPELGAKFESAHVSHTKGCYVGQEVLQRIHSRGHANKLWAVYESVESPAIEVECEGSAVGRVTRRCVVEDGQQLVGATVLMRAIGSGAPLTLGGQELRPRS